MTRGLVPRRPLSSHAAWTEPDPSRTTFGELFPAVAWSSRETPIGVWPYGKTYTHALRRARTALTPGSPDHAVHVTCVAPMPTGDRRSCVTLRPFAVADSSRSLSGERSGAISVISRDGNSMARIS